MHIQVRRPDRWNDRKVWAKARAAKCIAPTGLRPSPSFLGFGPCFCFPRSLPPPVSDTLCVIAPCPIVLRSTMSCPQAAVNRHPLTLKYVLLQSPPASRLPCLRICDEVMAQVLPLLFLSFTQTTRVCVPTFDHILDACCLTLLVFGSALDTFLWYSDRGPAIPQSRFFLVWVFILL
jgi:hypothetical protein